MGLASITNNIITDTSIPSTSVITGTLGTGQVGYGSAANTIAGSNNLFWDATNSRLGVGTNTPSAALQVTSDVVINGLIIGKGGGNIVYNTRVGDLAFISNTTGEANTAFGYQALRGNTTGYYSTAIGDRALRVAGSANRNTAVGSQALEFTTAGQNTAVGHRALISNTSGISNVAIGDDAGYGTGTNANTSGSNNIFIGQGSVGVSAGGSNRTWIGNSTTASTWLGGNLLLGLTTDGGQRLQVSGQTLLTHAPAYQLRLSDGTYKWDLWAVANVSNTDLRFIDNGGTARLTLFNGGNVSIGNNSNNASLSITGLGATSATNALSVSNSSGGTPTFTVVNDNSVKVGLISIYPTIDKGNSVNVAAGGLFIGYTAGTAYTPAPSVTLGKPLNFANTHTAGNMTMVSMVGQFAPTSGAGTFATTVIEPTINQTGGANGITRGLLVNPTLTAAADFRAIEWSNNTGWGLYGAGTAANYLGGALTVNSQITAGNAQATAGSVVLRSTYSSGNISNIGTNGSSGGMSINYGAYNASTSTADAYLSGVGTLSFPRSAYAVESDHRWLSAAAAIVAEGSAVTLTEKMRLYNSGNLVIQNGGTFTDAGERLQVIGNSRFSGTSTFTALATFSQGISIANTFKISSGTNAIAFQNNRIIFEGASAQPSGEFRFNFDDGGSANTNTSGNTGRLQISSNFGPNGGNATYTTTQINSTINQIGGATGVTRGLYVNPTLTAAVDWRSIEWSNNSGWGLYGVGTAPNYLAGELWIGYTTDQGAYPLQVNGSVYATSYFESSDIRLKDVITKKQSIDSFGAIQYKWKDGRDKNIHWGYSAQDVMNWIPDSVNINNDGHYTLDYNQAHTYKIATLEDRIALLEEEIKQLKNK